MILHDNDDAEIMIIVMIRVLVYKYQNGDDSTDCDGNIVACFSLVLFPNRYVFEN
jgi:hypothetical protein